LGLNIGLYFSNCPVTLPVIQYRRESFPPKMKTQLLIGTVLRFLPESKMPERQNVDIEILGFLM
jgi:hypothetical protein